jgi:hypothetical protein
MVSESALSPERRRSFRWWDRPGLTPRQERIFKWVSSALVVLFAIGWIFAIVDARRRETEPPILSGEIAVNPLSPEAPPPTPYLLDAATRTLTASRMRGYSGAVNVHVQMPGDTFSLPDTLPPGVRLEFAEPTVPGAGVSQPGKPGIWNLIVRMGNSIRAVPDLFVIQPVPLTEKKAGRIGPYVIGHWPNERGGRPRTPAYAPPAGLVRVTPQNMNTPVSEHFVLRDFLTKGQAGVWPKYVALSTRLLDKLELTIQELERSGHPVEHVGVISGFRTPTYNVSGGSTAGRGALSRHMYGDAMDIYIDNNRDGRMDDLNGDGRIDIKDARVLAAAAERVEQKYPSLIGGIGVYSPRPGAHSGFVHIDTRGYRARW